MDLNRDAMLVGLYIAVWSGRLYDRQASDHVAVAHEASTGAGRYNKRLLPKAAFAALTATTAPSAAEGEESMNEPGAPQSASPEEEARIAETPAVFANKVHVSPCRMAQRSHLPKPAGRPARICLAARGGNPAVRRSRRPAPLARLDRRHRRYAARALRRFDALSREASPQVQAPPCKWSGAPAARDRSPRSGDSARIANWSGSPQTDHEL